MLDLLRPLRAHDWRDGCRDPDMLRVGRAGLVVGWRSDADPAMWCARCGACDPAPLYAYGRRGCAGGDWLATRLLAADVTA